MVEEQRQRIEQEMTKMINDLDKQYLRKMQVKFNYAIKLYKVVLRKHTVF